MRKEIFKEFTKQFNRFICPICKEKLNLNNFSLKCINNHTFDISKKGTIVLCKTSKLKENKLYNDNLFINRAKFIQKGFYHELHNEIINIIKKYNIKNILDIGCGDGTHNFNLIKKLNSNIKLIGIDLSKEGINYASRYTDNNFITIVGDLHNLPFENNTFDGILNILSPINEKEVKRVLKEDGFIIKITPKKEYLNELRNVINISEYENEFVIDNNLKEKYNVIEKYEVNKIYDLTEDDFNCLINMTPMTQHKIIIESINKITIALNIYVMKVK